MAANKKKKGLLSILSKVAVAVAAAYLVVCFVGGQIEVAAKQRELAAVQAQVETQTQQNQELQQLMESGDADAYIERIAREKYGFVRPNELILVDLAGH